MLSLQEHRAARLRALEAEDGWLNLTARVDIASSTSSVGAGPAAEIQLSSGPDYLGTLKRAVDGFTFECPGQPSQAFHLLPDVPPQLRVPPFLLEIHTVDGVPALRVRDLTLQRQANLRYFPTDLNWVIRARWQTLDTPRKKAVAQRGGAETTVQLTHVAHFEHCGQPITLLATHWKAGKPMFVFRDQTAGNETYGAGRFLFGEDPAGGEITLDFNRAFTPPCGFSDFAICPLPPKENILPFRVEAGELAP